MRQTRPLEVNDFLKYWTISRPIFSPDGRKIAASVHQADEQDNRYSGDIFFVELEDGALTRFTYGGKDSSPRFSPDQRTLLFLSKRGMEKKEKGNELYILSLAGGEPRRLLKREEGIESPFWSRDSKKIYFLSNVRDDVEEQDLGADNREDENERVKVVRRLRLWFNGEGFLHNARKHLFSVNVDTGGVEQITSGEFDVSGFHESNNGRSLGYLASTDDMRPFITDLFLLGKDEESPGTKITNSEMMIGDFAWSPDDKQIALNASYYLPRGFASNSHIVILEPRPASKITKIESVDLNKGNSLNSDARQAAHASETIQWRREYIYYLQGDGGSVHLMRLNPNTASKPEQLLEGERSIEDYDVSLDGKKVAFVSMDASHLEELMIADEREARKLTSFNDDLYGELDILAPTHFTFEASDGAEIDCWVMAKDKSKKLPTILYIHGGPKTAFGNSYMHEFQVFAAKGYAVLYGNIRGSDGYSEEFADIRGHYGDRDYKDLLELVESASGKFPFIDRNRLGVAGGSYGGFMTNWVVTHTDVFKAAVTDRSIASWETFFGTSDIGPMFTKDQIGDDPFSGREKLERMSPIAYVKQMKTPLLIVHSMEDYRCWMVEGLELYTALKYLGRDVEMVLFPGENHDLSRTGKPTHRIIRLNHYLRWFDKYLKNESEEKSRGC